MLRSPEMLRRGTVVLAVASVLGGSACSAFSDSPEATAAFSPLETPIDTTPINLQIVDATVTGEMVDEKPEITREKDQYFEVYKKAGPASIQEIKEVVEYATSGRYIPSKVKAELVPQKAEISTCFDKNDDKQIEALEDIIKPDTEKALHVTVLNAEICPTAENYPVYGFAVKDGLTVLGRGAFVGGRFTQYFIHELLHQKNDVPHSGEAVCEDPVTLSNCSVDAEGNIKSPMSYEQTPSTPDEYKNVLPIIGLYEANLLRSKEVIENPEIGAKIPLVDMATEGVKIVVDTSGDHTVYFVVGREPKMTCTDKNSDTDEAGTYVATTASRDSNGNLYICRAPKDQEFNRSLDVYFDADTKIDTVHAVDIQDATTAIVNTEEFITSEASVFASQTELYRPVAKSLSTGRIYDSGTKVYEVVQDEAGNFVLSVSAS